MYNLITIINEWGVLKMSVSYKKLLKLLIDRDLKKTEFAKKAGISQNTLAKLSKNEFVAMEVLVKICVTLDVTFDDIVEIIKD